MARFLSLALLVLSTLLAGCILLPIPHDEWLSPRFYGRITDASTGLPLPWVGVTLSNFRFRQKTIDDVVTFTDSNGDYSIVSKRRSNWVGMMLGPADPASEEAHVRFEKKGYVPVEVERSWIVRGRHQFDTDIALKKEPPNQAAEPSRTTGTAPASAGARASVAPGSP
jgi:hypothetical protein